MLKRPREKAIRMSPSDNNDIQKILVSVVNYSDDAIITKTLEGIITSWNRGPRRRLVIHQKRSSASISLC